MRKYATYIRISFVLIVLFAGCNAVPAIQPTKVTQEASTVLSLFGKYSLALPVGWHSDSSIEKTDSKEGIRLGDCPNRPDATECPYDSIEFTLIAINRCSTAGIEEWYADLLVSPIEEIAITPSRTALTWLLMGLVDGDRHWCVIDSKQNMAIELRSQEADEKTKTLVRNTVLPQIAAQLQNK